MKVVQTQQSIFDIAITATGSIENAVDIAIQNGISITSPLKAGTILSLPTIVDNTKAVEKWALTQVVPGTATVSNGDQVFDNIFEEAFE